MLTFEALSYTEENNQTNGPIWNYATGNLILERVLNQIALENLTVQGFPYWGNRREWGVPPPAKNLLISKSLLSLSPPGTPYHYLENPAARKCAPMKVIKQPEHGRTSISQEQK